MLGLFQGQPGARIWRRYLSQNGTQRDAGVELLSDALATLNEAQKQAEEFINSKPVQIVG
jgi:tRNA-dihydrouridine synthase A